MTDKIKYECTWNPKEDITAYELALCLPFMGSRFQEIDEWNILTNRITRHFIVKEFDYGKMIEENAAKLKQLF